MYFYACMNAIVTSLVLFFVQRISIFHVRQGVCVEDSKNKPIASYHEKADHNNLPYHVQ